MRTSKMTGLVRASYLFLAIFSFMSLTAEIWSNDRPVVLYHNSTLSFPALFHYRQRDLKLDLGEQSAGVVRVDYRKIALQSGEFAIWPLNRWSPTESTRQVDVYPSAPTTKNWFGTDDRGRDVFARILYGFRNSLIYAVSVWLACAVLASLVGAGTAYAGGFVDLLGQRLVELITTVPQLFLLIYLVSLYPPSLQLLVAVSALLGWTGLSQYVRGEVLRNRKLEYIEAAKACGASTSRILFKHLLPNSIRPVLTLAPFMIIGNISGLAVLDFLGFGLPPPSSSWGELLQQGQTHFTTAWWLAAFPTLALFLTLLTITLVGEHLRSVRDFKFITSKLTASVKAAKDLVLPSDGTATALSGKAQITAIRNENRLSAQSRVAPKRADLTRSYEELR